MISIITKILSNIPFFLLNQSVILRVFRKKQKNIQFILTILLFIGTILLLSLLNDEDCGRAGTADSHG